VTATRVPGVAACRSDRRLCPRHVATRARGYLRPCTV